MPFAHGMCNRFGGNPGANGWLLYSTPIQMPPESGGICGGLTQDLLLGCFQGGAMAVVVESGREGLVGRGIACAVVPRRARI